MPAPVTPTERTRTYKEFLTPSLHRRFVSATLLLLLLCWAEATLLSISSSYLWSWFPIGPTGPRSLLLFGPCLAVFIIRIANVHIGARTTVSPAETAYSKMSGIAGVSSTLYTLGWYIWSGWFFGEVYIWSRPAASGLGWIDQGRPYERPRLNENPILIRFTILILSMTQGITHIARDYDRISISADSSGQTNHRSTASDDSSSVLNLLKFSQPLQELNKKSLTIARRVFNLTICSVILLTLPLYYVFLRSATWRWTFAIARTFFHDLPASAPPSGLLNVIHLSGQIVSVSVLLGLLWEVSNAVFDIFVAQPPIRKGFPLTCEIKDARGVLIQRSKDPNGSLITGLKSKKDVPKSFAFWELYLICTQYDERRKQIYLQVDRTGGSTWSQLCTYCLAEIEAIKARIATQNAPTEIRDKQQQLALVKQQQENLMPPAKDMPVGLPKIADQSVKTDKDVFSQRKCDLVQQVGNVAKTLGQSPGSYNDFTPRAKKALEWSVDKVLSKDQQNILSRQTLQREANGWRADLLKSPLGEPFRQTFARRATAIVLGTPYSNQANIVHAAKVLAKLTVLSLKEDDYGQVSKDIPKIVRTFTEVIVSIEKFTAGLQPSYTDVAFTAKDRNVKEIQETVDVLKQGLEDVILAFGEYAGTLGLSKKEIREAREAAARTRMPDMAQVLR